MSESNGRSAEASNGESAGRFEGYSHYKSISDGITSSIDDALSAYAELDSLHAEDAKIRNDQAARARSKIKLAALKLVPELRDDAHHNEQYRQILARWHGSFKFDGEDGTEVIQPTFPNPAPEEGYFEALSQVRLQQECPEWLEDWVIDIRTAGWEIGYLQAGRSVSPEPDVPDPEQEFNEMFADK